MQATQDLYSAVSRYIKEHEKDIVQDLITLCRVPSVATDGHRYPYGEEVNRALHTVRSLCERHGIFCRVEEERGYAVAFCDKEKQSAAVGLFAHCDVVPAQADEWIKCPPFEPLVSGELLYGRGTEDNKAAAVAGIYLLDMVKQGILPLKSPLMLYFGGDEERGMSDIHRFLTEEEKPEICLVPDNDFPVSFGEKGIMRIECVADKAFCDILSFSGGTAVNAVIGSVGVELRDESGALYRELSDKTEQDEAFSVTREGTVTSLSVRGISSHAAFPHDSVNAAIKAAEILSACKNLCREDRRILSATTEWLSDPFGSGADITAEDGKFGKNTLVLGIVSLCDGRLCCSLDCRFGPTRSSEEIGRRIRLSAQKYGFSHAEITEEKACYVADLPESTLAAFMKACREVSDPHCTPYYSAGGTYARYLPGGLSCSMLDSYGLPCVEESLPVGHGGAHQPDERIFLPALFKGMATMAAVLLSLDGATTASDA